MNDFESYFPAYLLWNAPANQPALVTRSEGKCVMLFTDNDLAERFLVVKPNPSIAIVQVVHPRDLIGFVEKCRSLGATHVSIDTSFTRPEDGPVKSLSNPMAAIQFFLDNIAKNWREQGEPIGDE
jgi:hypothetical protein